MIVYVLYIVHRHGNDISVHATEASARVTLYDYVKEGWDEDNIELSIESFPRDKAIEKYFDHQADVNAWDPEHYEIVERTVENN